MLHGEGRLLHNAVGKIFDDDFKQVVRDDRRRQKLFAFIGFQPFANLLEDGQIAAGQGLQHDGASRADGPLRIGVEDILADDGGFDLVADGEEEGEILRKIAEIGIDGS